jgi:hypothetical protein
MRSVRVGAAIDNGVDPVRVAVDRAAADRLATGGRSDSEAGASSVA